MNPKKKSLPSYKSQIFVGKVGLCDGKRKIALNAPNLLDHFLNQECRIGDDVSLYVTSKRPKRSVAQNNYLHLYLSLISLSSGHTTKELKSWYKEHILFKGIKEIYGEKTRITESSADLTIGEFCEFLCQIEEKTKIPCPVTDAFLKPLTKAEYADLKESQKQAYMKMVPKIVFKSHKSVV